MEYGIFNTDIDPGCDSIEVSSGPDIRKPGPGSSHDSSYVVSDIPLLPLGSLP